MPQMYPSFWLMIFFFTFMISFGLSIFFYYLDVK